MNVQKPKVTRDVTITVSCMGHTGRRQTFNISVRGVLFSGTLVGESIPSSDMRRLVNDFESLGRHVRVVVRSRNKSLVVEALKNAGITVAL